MEEHHLENKGVERGIILKWILEKWNEGMDWINLAQDRGRVVGCCECGNEP